MPMLERAKKIGRKFQNPVPTTIFGLSMTLKVLRLYRTNKEERIPRKKLGPFHTDAQIFSHPPTSGLRITWMGHSFMLIEMDGIRILVDPLWNERASPVTWAGPKPFFATPMPIAELPPLDAVLISHNHYDHLGMH